MPISLRTTLPAIILALTTTTTLSHAALTPSIVPVSLGNTIDSDGDGVPDLTDNAPGAFEPSQVDFDADGIGDIIDPTPAHSNPNLGDPGLTFFHPANITAGSVAHIQYTLALLTPPGAWGHIALDLNSDNITDALYFGPLDTSNTYTIDIPASLFIDAGWDLNTPGTYTFQAKAFAPGGSSDNFSIESITVTTPEPATLSLLTLAPLLLTRRKSR